MPDPRSLALDRALGALVGGALGDALGMPTQLLSPESIARTYGRVEGFVAPTPDHPVSRGLAPGTVTDDTEQTLLLAEVILAGGDGFDHAAWVSALTNWEADVRRRGGLDLLGPSTKRALEAIAAGVPPQEAGRHGNTNGAAMRIAPVGIATRLEPASEFIDRVEATCTATHGTSLAIASAAAVAAAISVGVAGGDWPAAAAAAVFAADLARTRGEWVAGADIAARIQDARSLVARLDPDAGAVAIGRHVGTSVACQESVPAAFAVVDLAGGDPWAAAVIAANLGGDTDTIGAIAAAMAGASRGLSALPGDRIAELRGFDLPEVRRLAAALVGRRFGYDPDREPKP